MRNVKAYFCPELRVPESNIAGPDEAVIVCGLSSLSNFQVAVAPLETVIRPSAASSGLPHKMVTSQIGMVAVVVVVFINEEDGFAVGVVFVVDVFVVGFAVGVVVVVVLEVFEVGVVVDVVDVGYASVVVVVFFVETVVVVVVDAG